MGVSMSATWSIRSTESLFLFRTVAMRRGLHSPQTQSDIIRRNQALLAAGLC